MPFSAGRWHPTLDCSLSSATTVYIPFAFLRTHMHMHARTPCSHARAHAHLHSYTHLHSHVHKQYTWLFACAGATNRFVLYCRKCGYQCNTCTYMYMYVLMYAVANYLYVFIYVCMYVSTLKTPGNWRSCQEKAGETALHPSTWCICEETHCGEPDEAAAILAQWRAAQRHLQAVRWYMQVFLWI